MGEQVHYIDGQQVVMDKESASTLIELSKNNPFGVLNDEAYDRMLLHLKLYGGTQKSYMSLCPHRTKSKCDCPYETNYLDDDDNIVRDAGDGKTKIVISRSMLNNLKNK